MSVPVAALGLMSGVLHDGTAWELHLTAHSTQDVRAHGEGLEFITTAGAWGILEREEVATLLLPDVPLRGFVQDSPDLLFDEDGHIGRMVQGAFVVDARWRPRGTIRSAWMDDRRLSVIVGRRRGRGVLIPERGARRRLPRFDVTARIDGDLWWGVRHGEWGGGYGTLGRLVNRGLNVQTFGEVGGVPVVAGGLCHVLRCDGEVHTLDGQVLHRGSSNIWIDRHELDQHAPIEWLGDVAGSTLAVQRDGRVRAPDRGWSVVGQLLHDHGSLVQRNLDVSCAARASDGRVWLAAPNHPLRALSQEVDPHSTPPSTPPLPWDLRWRHGQLWALDGRDAYVLDAGTWVRHQEPLPSDRAVPDWLRAITIGETGPTWHRYDLDTRSWSSNGPDPIAVDFVGTPVDTPTGIVAVSRTSCSGATVPCAVALDSRSDPGPEAFAAAGVLRYDSQWVKPGGVFVLPQACRGSRMYPQNGGGCLGQRWDEEVVQVLPSGDELRLGKIPRIRHAVEVGSTTWVVGEQIWRVQDAGLVALEGLPPVGRAVDVEPMDGGRTAIAVEAGVLILSPGESARPTPTPPRR